jgi:hypothetical protein
MTLQQAAAGVGSIDIAMLRQVERPDRMYRRAQRDVIDHVRLRREEISLDANSSRKMKFLLFPEKSCPRRVESIDGREMFAHACKLGLEGVVSKVRDCAYVSGRGNSWVKKTCAGREPLTIAGFRARRG